MNNASQRAARPPWLPFLMGAGLAAAAAAAYLPAARGGFIWDDDAYVTANKLLTAPDGLRRIWFSLDNPSQYFPLVYTMFFFERGWWGLNAAGYHWVNIGFHAANAVLAWRLFQKLGVRWAWCAAALFALHPVQAESVAWISERKNVLMVFFFFLTLLAWAASEDPAAKHPRRDYALAVIFYALALFAKTTACTLPAALFLIVWWREGKVGGRQWARILPFVVMGLAMGLLAVWWERYVQGTQGKLFSLSLPERLLIAGRSLWFQLGKLIWPVNMTFSYPRWPLEPRSPLSWGWLAACAGVAAAMRWARPGLGRGVETAAWFYAATLAPVLGFLMLFTFRYSYVADHYQYLACAGPLALAAAGAGRLADLSFLWRRAMMAAAACLLLILGVLTWRQCLLYADQETLWRDTLAKNPDSALAHCNLGILLTDRGRMDEGIAHELAALKLDPDFAEARQNLGNALLKKNQLDEAILQFQQALAIRPDFAQAYNNLGNALLQKGQVDAAVIQFNKSLALQPDYADAHYNLGNGLFQKGQTEQAIAEFQKAAALRPDFAEAHYNLGNRLLQTGRLDEAVVEFQKVVALRPDFANAHNNLANSLLQKGQVDQAVLHFQKALAIQPDFADAHNNLGFALIQKGQTDEAVLHFQKAFTLQQGSVEAQNDLARVAWLLATSPNPSLRNGAKAIELARQTDQLSGGNNPRMAAILAAAYAEAGQFAQAVATAQRALQLAASQNNTALVAAIEAQLKLYQAGSPFRDTTASP